VTWSRDLSRAALDVRRVAIPSALIALGIVLVAVAPTERTLGAGIRWVYVHVGLVWAGTLGLGIAAALGVAACASGRAALGTWTWATWRAGLAAFALGVVFSMVAARVNWGAVFLAEPRMAASLRFLALAAIIQVIAAWVARPRVTGALALATFALLLWLVGGAELVLHPRDPVRTATSAAIQGTFALSFVLAAALTAWATVRLVPARGPR
jgi:hypothetical protein